MAGMIGYSANGWLACPNCGYDNLYHMAVEIFERDEDEPRGIHVVVQGPRVLVDREIKKNPSRRRQGLLVSFFCEQCSATPTLALIQHKGNTYLEWQR